MMSDEILGINELSHREWFQGNLENSGSEVLALIDATGLDLDKRACPEKFRNCLNRIIGDSVWYQIKGLRKKEDTRKLLKYAGAIIKYVELSEKLNAEGDNLPTIPKALLGQFQLLQFDFSKVDTRHKPRTTTNWMHILYPECLALFAAAFGEYPKSTYNEDTGQNDNATILFFEHILVHVGKQQDELGLDDRFGCDSEKASLCWELRSNRNTIRSQIAKGLKIKLTLPADLPDEEVAIFDQNSAPFQSPLWKTLVGSYQRKIAKDPTKD